MTVFHLDEKQLPFSLFQMKVFFLWVSSSPSTAINSHHHGKPNGWKGRLEQLTSDQLLYTNCGHSCDTKASF